MSMLKTIIWLTVIEMRYKIRLGEAALRTKRIISAAILLMAASVIQVPGQKKGR